MTMAKVISAISEVFTAAIGWVGTVSETVAGIPCSCWALSLASSALVSACSRDCCTFDLRRGSSTQTECVPLPRTT